MTRTTHKFTANNYVENWEGVCISDNEVKATYTYLPGTPERPPAYDHGGLPADPPEIEVTAISIDGFVVDPKDRLPDGTLEFDYWAEWMTDRHYDAMCELAEDDRQEAHEQAAERRREERREERS